VAVSALSLSETPGLASTATWSTYQHDPARSGQDLDQPALTSARLDWTAAVDGPVYAQPLVVGARVYVATENNSLYAFDATLGSPAWHQALVGAVPNGSLPCGNISPSVGITSTPVIDTRANVLYAVGLVTQPSIHHELWAVDLTNNGAVLYHYPIDPPGADPTVQGQCGALTLANRLVYVPFGGRYSDCGTYHGYVVGVHTGDCTGNKLVYQNTTQATRAVASGARLVQPSMGRAISGWLAATAVTST